MSPRIVRLRDLPVVPWKNGGGTTRELLVLPFPDGSPRLRVSMAQVASDGPFSAYPGVSRALTVLTGDPLALVADGVPTTLGPGQVLAFDGGATTTCRLTGAPVLDLGVMAWGGRRARLELVPAAGAAVPASAVAAVVTRGPVRALGEVLDVGDAVLLDDGDALELSGTGDIGLVLDEA